MFGYGKRLRELRKEKEYSQLQLAVLLKTTQSTIGKYEREFLQPDISMIIDICKLFNVTSDYLLGLSPYRDGYREVS